MNDQPHKQADIPAPHTDHAPVPQLEPPAQPLTAPSKSGSYVGLWIGLGVLFAVLLLSGGLVWYIVTRSDSPLQSILSNDSPLTHEERLYAALENNMNTSVIRQTYTSELSGQTVTNDAISDFSDPANPRTKTTFLIGAKDQEPAIDIDMIGTTSYCEYGRINKVPADIAAPLTGQRDYIGKWLKAATKEESTRTFDPFSICSSINKTYGEILVGNYSSDDRQDLMRIVRTKQPYRFNEDEVQAVTRGGKKQYKYYVTLNREAVQQLNDLAAARLGLEGEQLPGNATKASLWIDATSNRFTRVETSSDGMNVTVDLSYPSSADIQLPTETLPVTSVQQTRLQ